MERKKFITLDKAINNEKFLQEILDLNTSEKIKNKFESEGIKITTEQSNEILEIKDMLNSGKLPEGALELIAGGKMSKTKGLSSILALTLTTTSLPALQSSKVDAMGLFSSPKLSTSEVLKKYPDVIKYNNQTHTWLFDKSKLKDVPEQYWPVFQNYLSNVNTMDTRVDALNLKPGDEDLNEKIGVIGAKGAVAVTDATGEGLKKTAKMAIPIVGGSLVVKYAGDIIEHIKNFYASGSNAVKKVFYKLTHRGIDIKVYEKVLERIEQRLRRELVGQDKAINEIIKIMTGYFESIVQAKAMGKKFEGGLILYLIGSPGTGKSTTMKIIEEEMGLDSYTGRMSDAIEDKGNGAQTVASRLTKPVIEDNGKVKVSVDTKLTNQVKSMVPTLYCLDEVDKMRVYDSVLQNRGMRNERGKIIGGSIDEMLRNFGDTGQIAGFNASGSILIATSNETSSQMAELEESLYNRYKGCTVAFKEFSANDYKEIILRKFKDIQEYYKTKFNVKISWSNSALEHFSKVFEKENSGGRAVDVLMNTIRHALKEHENKKEPKIANKNILLEYDNGIKVTVKY